MTGCHLICFRWAKILEIELWPGCVDSIHLNNFNNLPENAKSRKIIRAMPKSERSRVKSDEVSNMMKIMNAIAALIVKQILERLKWQFIFICCKFKNCPQLTWWNFELAWSPNGWSSFRTEAWWSGSIELRSRCSPRPSGMFRKVNTASIAFHHRAMSHVSQCTSKLQRRSRWRKPHWWQRISRCSAAWLLLQNFGRHSRGGTSNNIIGNVTLCQYFWSIIQELIKNDFNTKFDIVLDILCLT